MRFPFSVLFIILLSPMGLMTQGNVPYQHNIVPDVPPSPQAVAFNRLADYQVNNNYGVPDINIPLFEIDFHGFKIPLTMHYEATPMKSGYNYDVTGLGWTLSGNSCVSRTIKDRADDNGIFSNPLQLDDINRSYESVQFNFDHLNFQYDTYNIVLPSGRSIPFFMYRNENGILTYQKLPSDYNVKITCSFSQNKINGFTVVDEDGVTYHFTDAEWASNVLQGDYNAQVYVTWLLTSIDIPAKGTITYIYTDVQHFNSYTVTEEPVVKVSRLFSYNWNEAPSARGYHVSEYPQTQSPRYSMKFISRILYGPTVVCFNYQSDNRHLKEIVVSDNGDTVRKFRFTMSGADIAQLTSLEFSGQNNDDKLVYGFDYTGIFPGNRTDYWGNRCYSNAQTDIGNFNLFIDKAGIVDTTNFRLTLSGNYVQFSDNAPDELSAYYKLKLQSTPYGDTRQPTSPNNHGVLRAITYPNGGRTTFNYEQHRFPTATASNGNFVFDRRSQRIIEGSGFRIEAIKNWTADGQLASEDYYRYGFTYGDIVQRNFPLPLPENYNINNHIGCGEAVVDPTSLLS